MSHNYLIYTSYVFLLTLLHNLILTFSPFLFWILLLFCHFCIFFVMLVLNQLLIPLISTTTNSNYSFVMFWLLNVPLKIYIFSCQLLFHFPLVIHITIHILLHTVFSFKNYFLTQQGLITTLPLSMYMYFSRVFSQILKLINADLVILVFTVFSISIDIFKMLDFHYKTVFFFSFLWHFFQHKIIENSEMF